MLEQFRERTGRDCDAPVSSAPLSRREWWLLSLTAIYLLIVSWVLAGVFMWTQFVLLGLAILTFAMLFLPVEKAGMSAIRSSTAGENGHRLRRFPPFWIGLGFFAYVLIQTLNPDSSFHFEGGHWWVTKLDHIPWLPSGIEAPFYYLNGWRMLLIWIPVWFVGCALWVGLRRRKAVRILMLFIAGNAFVWGLVAIVQDQIELPKMLGVYESTLASYVKKLPDGQAIRMTRYWGAMINTNHASTFLNLGAVVQLGLFLLAFSRARQRLSRSSRHYLYLILASVTLVASVMALSRAGLALSIGLTLLAIFIYLLIVIRLRHHMGDLTPGLVVVLALMLTSYWALPRLNIPLKDSHLESTQAVLQEPSRLVNSLSMDRRWSLNRATWQMFQDRWLTGWGAGSYFYVLPPYQRQYEELMRPTLRWHAKPDRAEWQRSEHVTVWRHAHNDIFQYLAELGVLGVLFILILFVWAGILLIRALSILQGGHYMLIMGTFLVLMHAWVDFVLYIPALIFAYSIIALLTLKLISLERELNSRSV